MATTDVNVEATVAIGATGWTFVGASSMTAAVQPPFWPAQSVYARSPALGSSGTIADTVVRFASPNLAANAHVAAIRMRVQGEGEYHASGGEVRSRPKLQPGPGTIPHHSFWAYWQLDGVPQTLLSPDYSRRPGGSPWTVADTANLHASFNYSRPSTSPTTARGRCHVVSATVLWTLPPSTTVTGPAATVTDTTRPVVTFTATNNEPGSHGGDLTIRAYEAEVRNAAGDVVWSSGVVEDGVATSVAVGTSLSNAETYTARVRHRLAPTSSIWTVWGEWAERTFVLDVPVPSAPLVEATPYPLDGYVRLSIAHDPGPTQTHAFRVEASDEGGPWRPVRFIADPIVGQGPHEVVDVLAPVNGPRTYRVRALSFLDDVELASAPTYVTVHLEPRYAWLTNANDPERFNVRALLTAAARVNRGRETVHRPAGRSTAIVESEPGTREWELALITQSPEERAAVEVAFTSPETLVLRTSRDTAYVRWVGDRTRALVGPEVAETDEWAGTVVEVDEP